MRCGRRSTRDSPSSERVAGAGRDGGVAESGWSSSNSARDAAGAGRLPRPPHPADTPGLFRGVRARTAAGRRQRECRGLSRPRQPGPFRSVAGLAHSRHPQRIKGRRAYGDGNTVLHDDPHLRRSQISLDPVGPATHVEHESGLKASEHEFDSHADGSAGPARRGGRRSARTWSPRRLLRARGPGAGCEGTGPHTLGSSGGPDGEGMRRPPPSRRGAPTSR